MGKKKVYKTDLVKECKDLPSGYKLPSASHTDPSLSTINPVPIKLSKPGRKPEDIFIHS